MVLYFTPQIATNTLERVAPLTHAVGNVLKRVFVIGFSIIVFGKNFSLILMFFSSVCNFKIQQYDLRR